MTRLQRLSAWVVMVGLLGTPMVLAQTNPNTLNTLDRRLVRYTNVVLTNAQLLALHTTPITLVPAQGASTVVEPLGGVLSFNGSVAYTINGSNLLRLWYTSRLVGPAASATITTAGFLDQSSATIINFGGVPANEIITANKPVVLQDTTGVAYSGGGASDTVTVRLAYRVHNQ